MGYVRPTLKLVFDEEHHGDLAGLEVRMKRPSVDQLMRVSQLMSLRGKDDADLTDTDREQIDGLFDLIAAHLLGWNLEEEGGAPVPATAQALRGQDVALVYGVIGSWMDAAAGVSAPLAPPSSGGNPSLEDSIPTQDSQSLSLVS